MRLQVLLFDDVEELDAIGPWEVLRFWQRLSCNVIEVTTVGWRGEAVRCALGLHLLPDAALSSTRLPDVLVHPGGPGTVALLDDQAHLRWVRDLSAGGALMASVCTGAQVFAAAGILDGHTATTHWRALDQLADDHPEIAVRRGVRWVDDGNVVSSAGVAAGIDMALHLVARLESESMALQVASAMEYSWDPTS